MNRKPLDTMVTILFGVACLTISIVAVVYLVRLSPAAKPSDVAKVAAAQQKAAAAISSVSIEAKEAQADAEKADKPSPKFKTVNQRLSKDESDIALLKRRVDLLDGSALKPAVKRARR